MDANRPRAPIVIAAGLAWSALGCAGVGRERAEPPAVAAAATTSSTAAANAPVVVVDGDLTKPAAFDAAALERLGAEDVTYLHDEERFTFRGVPLHAVLAACGQSSGPGGCELAPHRRRPGWGKIVVAWGADGHQAVDSCAELDPVLGASTKSWLAWQVDGGPLPAEDGAFRLFTTTDLRGFRSVRRLGRIEVRDVRVSPDEP